jgi:hypothetical protein
LTARDLARGALDWLVATARPVGDGLAWGETAEAEPDVSLYTGTAGIVLTLLDGRDALGDDAYAEAAARGARWLARQVDEEPVSCLYYGLGGMAYVLKAAAERLDDPIADGAWRRAVARLRADFDGEGWNEFSELFAGNAGIALAALAVGDLDLALLAIEPLRRRAEPTAAGVTWQHRRGVAARLHHVAHGALGIAYAMAAVGNATGSQELVATALAGAAEVVARNEAGPGGFLVPHSDPPYKPEIIERYSYGWCNGPAGDAQVFRRLAAITGDPAWIDLVDRCWRTVVDSGLPKRLRPGFWDNNGRCCGTAGVLALALDLGDHDFAGLLVRDLRERATIDAAGVRWSNVEHRATPSELPPMTGWAMGNAGIAHELLRL